MTRPRLIVGNKNYSSWSMRPWLALTWAGIDLDEQVIPLGGEGYGKSHMPAVLAVSPSGRVPVLHLGEERIWDSLAIAEWAAEERPEATLWPTDRLTRALCRSVACEMHSSFAALRRDLSMNIRRRTGPRDWADDVRRDVARIEELWGGLRLRFSAEGPFLFGRRTLADAMFAPVCTRFRTYAVNISDTAEAYCEAIFADAAFQAWERAALDEPWSIAETDAL